MIWVTILFFWKNQKFLDLNADLLEKLLDDVTEYLRE
jgi:hypothetical protein